MAWTAGIIRITNDFASHMELPHIMDTANIGMFSFYGSEEQESVGSYRGKVMEQLGQFVDYAAANGIVLLHENEKGIYGEIAEGCMDILKQFTGFSSLEKDGKIGKKLSGKEARSVTDLAGCPCITDKCSRRKEKTENICFMAKSV